MLNVSVFYIIINVKGARSKKMTEINLNNPHIFEAKRFIYKQKTIDMRRVKDYEIDYYLSGTRNMTVDNEKFSITEGTLIFRKPGQFVISEGNYDMYVLTLNFSSDINISPENYRRDRSSAQQPYSHLIYNLFKLGSNKMEENLCCQQNL